jgi:hypothetical protein
MDQPSDHDVRCSTWEPAACAQDPEALTSGNNQAIPEPKFLASPEARWKLEPAGAADCWQRGGDMSKQVELRCRCGQVSGIVTDASPRTVNRVVCYCDDCQAFAHRLGRADLLDTKGGSDIVQVAPASLTFVQGQHLIAGLRLTPKGLFRWHTTCCNTPIGNTLTPALPFVGILVQAFETGTQKPDDVFGAPVGAILGKYAIGQPPAGSTGINLSLLVRAIGKVLGWRLRGRTRPHPFFKPNTREPVYPLTVLSAEQRDALRAFCGPHPTARAT